MKGTVVIFALLAATAFAGELTCPEDQADNWEIESLLVHPDCNKFYKCTFGEPVEQDCFGGLYFNLDTWQCDWPENVECGDRNDPAAPVVPEESSEEVIPEESSEEVVPEESSEEVVPEEVVPEESSEEVVPEESSEEVVPEESSEEVIPEESSEEVVPEESSEEVVPEESSEEVVPEESSEEVVPEESSEEVVPEESSEDNNEFLANGCPVDPHVHWLLPHEENAGQFYYCVWGEKVLRDCPATLVFNPVIQVCDWPQQVASDSSRTALNKHLEARRMMSNML